jgi:hypothetical protein
MPPRLLVSSHETVPFITDVRSIVGPPTMPPICISSTRFILSGRTMMTVEVPSMSRPPIDRRNGPSALRPLSAVILSSPPSALRVAETIPATRSCAASGEYEIPSMRMNDATITMAAVEINLRMSAAPVFGRSQREALAVRLILRKAAAFRR